MAITTYAELQTAVTSWMDVTAATLTTQIADVVMLGEKWIMRNVRSEDMEAALSSAISSGTLSAPTGFIGLKHAYIDGSPVQSLSVRSPAALINQFPLRSADNKPQWIAYDAGSFIFGPYPDSNYTVKGTYYKRQGPLSSGVYNLFTNNPDLYLFACLAESELIIGRDQRIALWTSKRDSIAQAVNTEAKGIMAGGGLVISVG